jgi:hypothetical protein
MSDNIGKPDDRILDKDIIIINEVKIKDMF